ncbi:MAG: VanZ family protein [Butyrivibrio sp.]|nr:VanZ family protein [Acetatifactor muris]MCM1558927.1 VanZ family protein [Butyrivibrio sp.]
MTTWNPYVFEKAYIVVPAILVCLIFLQIMLCRLVKDSEKKIRYSAGMWLLFHIFTVLCATIIERPLNNGVRVQLELFWTIKRAWAEHSGRYWYNIIGNIALFIPMGALLPTAFRRMRAWWKVSLAGFLFSGMIELSQYVFRLGLCEYDDLMHNNVGVFLGYQVFIVLSSVKAVGRGKTPFPEAKVMCAMGVIVTVILLFLVLLIVNQPDWSGVTVF